MPKAPFLTDFPYNIFVMEGLLQTKLYIPQQRPNLVPRPDLVERLNQGLQLGHKLTLVSAPAGFGKTTLVAEWLSRSTEEKAITPSPAHPHTPSHIAWLSLDEGDNDPARFLAYLIAALNRIGGLEAAIGRGALGMLQSPQPPPAEDVLVSLINDIDAIPDRIILVLDDYHLIESSTVDQALAFLLEHLPTQMQLVIATREDPNFHLARLRARGQLTELRATDLRFSSSEAAEFLNRVMGLNLSAADIAALESRTEGWIAGLQMAAISMQGSKDAASFIRSFTGSHRYVLDYLIEEVLEQQSEDVQNFLLQTAVLNRMTGPLCDALTDREDGRATLESLEHANLFVVPMDEERYWYRYHHLFADLLYRRLQQIQRERVPTLHRRASEWYEQNGFADEAIEHALRAEDFGRAARQIEAVAQSVWTSGVDAQLRRWLVELPSELLFSRPKLCIFQAWYLLAAGEQDGADRALQAAEQALELDSEGASETAAQEQDQPPGLNKQRLRGRIATTQAFSAFYRGDIEGIIQQARRALEYLPEQDLYWRSIAIHLLGDAYDFNGEIEETYRSRLEAVEASRASGNNLQIMIANLKLAIVLRNQGQLQRVAEICQQQMKLANENGLARSVVTGWLLAIWGEVLAELNDLDGAMKQAKKGVEITERGGDLAMLGWSYLCLIRILFTHGELAAAEEMVHKVENIARGSEMPPWFMNLNAAWQARIWLAQGKLRASSQWVGKRGLDGDREPTYLHEVEYIALARILIAQRQLNEAIGLLQRLLEAAETGGRTSRAIEILMLQALAFQARGDAAQAITTFERTLTLAKPGGFIRIFVDEGPPMAHLLDEALNRGMEIEYTRLILGAFSGAEQDRFEPSRPKAPESGLIEPLSERELEILQLIAEGLTNREIAARLFLSLNTIKVHTRNIYGKLSVHSRTQAIAKAQELGLLLGK